MKSPIVCGTNTNTEKKKKTLKLTVIEEKGDPQSAPGEHSKSQRDTDILEELMEQLLIKEECLGKRDEKETAAARIKMLLIKKTSIPYIKFVSSCACSPSEGPYTDVKIA